MAAVAAGPCFAAGPVGWVVGGVIVGGTLLFAKKV